jgi:hypothetical protein
MVILVGAGATLSGWGMTTTTARCDASRQGACYKLRQVGASGRNLFFQRFGPPLRTMQALQLAARTPALAIMDNRR